MERLLRGNKYVAELRPPSLPHISHLLKQIVVVIAVKFVFNFFLSSSNETSNSKTFPPTSNEITLITVSEVFFFCRNANRIYAKICFCCFPGVSRRFDRASIPMTLGCFIHVNSIQFFMRRAGTLRLSRNQMTAIPMIIKSFHKAALKR